MTFYAQASDDNGDQTNRWAMKVNVMGCSQCPDWALDAAFEGIKKAHNDIYASTNVPGTRIISYTTDFTANSCDEGQERSEANNWLDANGFGGKELYLFVSNCGMARTYGHAWQGRCVGFVGAGDGYYDDPGEMSVMAIHESLHAFIYQLCNLVQDEAGSSVQTDHKLGHILEVNGTDKATPMVASYAKDPSNNFAESGNCDNYSDISWGDWTRYMSLCTLDSINHTLDHFQ